MHIDTGMTFPVGVGGNTVPTCWKWRLVDEARMTQPNARNSAHTYLSAHLSSLPFSLMSQSSVIHLCYTPVNRLRPRAHNRYAKRQFN